VTSARLSRQHHVEVLADGLDVLDAQLVVLHVDDDGAVLQAVVEDNRAPLDLERGVVGPASGGAVVVLNGVGAALTLLTPLRLSAARRPRVDISRERAQTQCRRPDTDTRPNNIDVLFLFKVTLALLLLL
jgi:hypothetical protein